MATPVLRERLAEWRHKLIVREFTLTVPLDALEAGERQVLGERRELVHVLKQKCRRV